MWPMRLTIAARLVGWGDRGSARLVGGQVFAWIGRLPVGRLPVERLCQDFCVEPSHSTVGEARLLPSPSPAEKDLDGQATMRANRGNVRIFSSIRAAFSQVSTSRCTFPIVALRTRGWLHNVRHHIACGGPRTEYSALSFSSRFPETLCAILGLILISLRRALLNSHPKRTVT